MLLSYQKKHLSQTKRLHFRRARKALGWRRAGQKKPSHLAYKTIRFHADGGTHRFGTELAPEPPRDWHIKQLRSLATMPPPFPVKSMTILARLMANERSPCRAQWHIRKDHAPLCAMCNGGRARCLAAGPPSTRRTDNTRLRSVRRPACTHCAYASGHTLEILCGGVSPTSNWSARSVRGAASSSYMTAPRNRYEGALAWRAATEHAQKILATVAWIG